MVSIAGIYLKIYVHRVKVLVEVTNEHWLKMEELGYNARQVTEEIFVIA